MADMDERQADVAQGSAGARAAAVVRGVGGGAADLTEGLGRAAGAAMAGTLRGLTRAWGGVLSAAVDGVVGAVRVSTRRRRSHPGAPGGSGSGAQVALDLTDLRTAEQIDEAVAQGLAAAAPPGPPRGTQ